MFRFVYKIKIAYDKMMVYVVYQRLYLLKGECSVFFYKEMYYG